jgi:hypothetical protein
MAEPENLPEVTDPTAKAVIEEAAKIEKDLATPPGNKEEEIIRAEKTRKEAVQKERVQEDKEKTALFEANAQLKKDKETLELQLKERKPESAFSWNRQGLVMRLNNAWAVGLTVALTALLVVGGWLIIRPDAVSSQVSSEEFEEYEYQPVFSSEKK